ncbi:MAG: arginine--tRNA ligase [Candidatus Harrisonbacteria bacterium]|nr:arginine--tRNA ligase [Candidatus Harrisonbacteria bacterium]
MQKEVITFIQSALELSSEPSVDVPEQASFGHYSTNIAMSLAKEAGKNPRELAEEFTAKLNASNKEEVFEKIEVAGPGFINFWLSAGTLQRKLQIIDSSKKLKIGKGQKVIIEYSSPNIAKPMHVGHFRTTIIGDSLANIFEYAGYNVIRWNYLGDWGTQFGKLIAAYKKWGNREEIEKAPIASLLHLYVRFHKEKDESSERAGQQEFKKLAEGDRENRKLWKWFKKLSLEEFEKTYKELGVKFDVVKGESEYNKGTKELIGELKEKGIAHESQGAVVVDLESEGADTAILEKADGVSVYLTRELQLLKERRRKYKPDQILVVVGNEQTLHFKQLGLIAGKLGLLESLNVEHIKYGLVLGPDGKKFSTREGSLVELNNLLAEAKERTRKLVEQKNPKLSGEEKEKVSKTVALGALKYNDLKENRHSGIVFNWEAMLDFNGNSGPYLQYSYARIKSILKKGKKGKADYSKLSEAIELSLVKKLLDFEEVVSLCAQNHLTSYLATYLFELAKLSNHYYEKIHILSDKDTERLSARLELLEKVGEVLKQGLNLLGIEVLEEI